MVKNKNIEDKALDEIIIRAQRSIENRDGTKYIKKKHNLPESCIKSKAELDEMRVKSIEATKQRARDRAAKKRAICEYAFNLTDFDIYAELTNEHVSTLKKLLLSDRLLSLKKCEDSINSKITSYLSKFIPKVVKQCYKEYPLSMREYCGFIYYASKEFGNGLNFFAKPNIPVFYQSGEEMKVLLMKCSDKLYSLDKQIVRYYEQKELLGNEANSYEHKLSSLKSKTFAGLLEANPFWFDLLYNYLITKK